MRLGHGRDDRETEPRAAARTRPRRVGSVEALERVRDLLRIDPRAGVRDLERGDPVPAAQVDAHGRSVRRVRANVGEQIVDDLPQPVAVAEHDGGVDVGLDRPLGIDGLRSLDGFGDDLVQRDRLARERPPLVEAREQQEIVDEHAHALGLAADPAHRALQIGGPVRRAAREELGVGAHRGKRRAQLVRRVGDEAAQLPLGRLERAHRGLARRRRGLDLAEHPVQREPEPADLRPSLRARDALRQVAGGDLRRRRTRSPRADAARAARPRARAARCRPGRAP